MIEGGKWLMIAGAILFAGGALWYFAPGGWLMTAIRKLGHLPGDIRIEKENFRFYVPLTTMLLLSLLVNLLMRAWNFFNNS
ncbi:MAG: DUF2905 domain-containing protein [Saprospiraceae bacterium]|jgi:hypothetical protein|nr:DUF2905 domain-containing protein [Saprospiraceae bacterium]